ncbi:deoxyribose-phosphate aldolase [Aliibacillus thermotolerans]|uniref:Deoxyribose-phosphate aldolase n=1 Tax=Aliibacillus thermotolerans TaxID=1834418 RepID=A0ABW0U8E6_9BACI|nr:deoxyribose-phosphate aldolase [Aliibacillus thermotolerans]MDA3130747.1 deoxyribose-phosphate aldolase [Aliibacillus thermotolerans]
MESTSLAKVIDHTLLKPEATVSDVVALAREAKQYGFFSVCVQPSMVKTAYEILADTDVNVCTVIGFPLGATFTSVKVFEAKEAINAGASELDMVMAIGALKAGNDEYVKQDIQSVVEAAKDQAIVKVIIETALLTDQEKEKACQLAVEAGADFVKTSSGFSGGGAKVADVERMKKIVGEKAKVKASGGIRTKEAALEMLEAGADRLGTSASLSIIEAMTYKGDTNH